MEFTVKYGVRDFKDKVESVSSKRYKLVCAPIEDCDQPAPLWSMGETLEIQILKLAICLQDISNY